MPAHKHVPTATMRAQASAYAAVGVPQDDIARLLGIGVKALTRHYVDELKKGKARANAQIATRLYAKANDGNLGAMCFWLKCQAGWREIDHRQMLGKDGKPIDPAPSVLIVASALDQKL